MAGVSAAEEYRHRLGIWTDIQGHLEFMHSTVLEYHHPAVVELGIQAGNSTCALLSAAKGAGGRLWSCDIRNREELAGETSGGLRRVPDDWWDDPAWNVFCGDDLSAETLAWMPAQCDVLFIDSDHSYEHVRGVLDVYVPRVKPGGTVLLHDTHWVPGDDDLPAPDGPVAQALTAYCDMHGLSWEDRPGFYGMGIVRP